MRLPLRGGGADGGRPADAGRRPRPTRPRSSSAAPSCSAPVLARVVGALAARRDLSVDRVSDAVLVTDAIAAAAPGRFADGSVRLGLAERDDGLELRLGPMDGGGAEEIREELEVPEVGGSLEALADELAVEEADDGDYLAIRFSSPAPAP